MVYCQIKVYVQKESDCTSFIIRYYSYLTKKIAVEEYDFKIDKNKEKGVICYFGSELAKSIRLQRVPKYNLLDDIIFKNALITE